MLTALLEKIRIATRNTGCFYCHKPMANNTFCPACREKLGLRDQFPLSTLGPPIEETRLYAATLFNPTAKSLLYGYKFYHNTGKRPILTELLATYWQTLAPTLPAETLVLGIPAHSGKISLVEPIARPFTLRFGYRFSNRVLNWQREVEPQHTLSARKKRVDNVRHAMAADATVIPKTTAHILIIDDLTTTGATLREAIRALREAGATCPVTGLAVTHIPLAFQKKKCQSPIPHWQSEGPGSGRRAVE